MGFLSLPFAPFRSGVLPDSPTQNLSLELGLASSRSFAWEHPRSTVGNVNAISPRDLDAGALLPREPDTDHRHNFADTWNVSGRVEDLNRSGIFNEIDIRLPRSACGQPLGNCSPEEFIVPDISDGNTLFQLVEGSLLRSWGNTLSNEVATDFDLNSPLGTSSFSTGLPVSSCTFLKPVNLYPIEGEGSAHPPNAAPLSNGFPSMYTDLSTSQHSEDARWLIEFFAGKSPEGSHCTGDLRSPNPNEDGLSLNNMLGNNPYRSVHSRAHFNPPVHPNHTDNVVELHSGVSYLRRGRRPSPKWVPDGLVSIQRLFSKMMGTLWAQDFCCQWGSCAFSISRQSFDNCEMYLKAVYHHIQGHVDESPTFLCKWKGCVRDPLRQVRCRRSVKRNHFHHIASHLAWYYFCASCGTLHARFDSPKGLLCSRGKCQASDEPTRIRVQEASRGFGDLQAVPLALLWELITGSPEVKAPT